MELLKKTSLIFITISLFVFFISGILLYVILKNTSDKNINRELMVEFENVSRNLDNLLDTGKTELILPLNLNIIKVEKPDVMIANGLTLKDTILTDPVNHSFQKYRKVTGYQNLNDFNYSITIYKSLIQSEELIEQLIIALTSMTILLILAVFFVTKNISGKIWSDFFKSLETIKGFELTKTKKVTLPPSDISEFNELNSVLNIMIDRIYSDFENLKEFTENITHEMQTPLAIIKSKFELFLQIENLSEEQAMVLSDITANISRLKKLNQGLVLLSRIENKQFTETNPVEIHQVVQDIVENLSYYSDSRNLQVSLEIDNPITVHMNNTLADVLISNLIKNAFVHSPENATVRIKASAKTLYVKNTGPDKLHNLKIFSRFVKANSKTNSLGIGLSLVRKICSQYGFEVGYTYEKKFHIFFIRFR